MIDVSVIIVSYNTREMTLDCLRSVLEQTRGITYETIVVDNDSSDQSADAIRDAFPDVTLIASEENLGFARANNLAAESANGKYLLLLNPDTVVLGGAIQNLFMFAQNNPHHLIYGGRTLYGDRTLNHTSCWKKPSVWSLFCYATGLTSMFRRSSLFDPESYGSWQRDSVRTVDIVTGCFLMIEKRLWDRLKGFDPVFFMYGEDADLCMRAMTFGADPVITPEATIIHYRGASEKIRADKMVRLFRAKEQLIRRHWQSPLIAVGIFLLRTSVFSRAAATNLMKRCGLKDANDKADSWGDIWRRRVEWQTN